MNTGITHPFTGALYELTEDGNILVSEAETTGLFRPDGRWISGTIREADPQLCVWVANVVEEPESTASDSHLAQN